jgi:hypothetical protein
MANGTLKVSNIETSSGSGTITLGASGETVDLSNGTITLNSTMKATPAFEAYMSANQTLSNNTLTKVNLNTERFDTDSKYDTSAYRFTPGVAGKYFVYIVGRGGSSSNVDVRTVNFRLYLNGSTRIGFQQSSYNAYNLNYMNVTVNTIIDLNTTDYLETYCAIDVSGGTPTITGGTEFTLFGAYRIIGA